jgi:transcriptional regulator with XRE-family HTH domain
MTKYCVLKRRWMKDPEFRRAYFALEDEFAFMRAVSKARLRSGLSRTEIMTRMKTTQRTLDRLENGRGPSTRTLDRFAKATGHRLKISFEPVEVKAAVGRA